MKPNRLLALFALCLALASWVQVPAQSRAQPQTQTQPQTKPQPAEPAGKPAETPMDPALLGKLRLSEEDETCTICTPDERLQLRLRRNRALAAEMRSLLEEVRPLQEAGQLLEVLVKADGLDTSDAGQELLDMIRNSARRPAPRPQAARATPGATARVSSASRGQIYAVFAQAPDPERGVPANAIVRVGRRDHVLGIGKTFDANGAAMRLTAIEETAGELVVVVTDERSGRKRRLPWK